MGTKGEKYDSCPMLSPLPSSLLQPEEVDSEDLSQVSKSLADMFTRVLNSLRGVSPRLRSRERGGRRGRGVGLRV